MRYAALALLMLAGLAWARPPDPELRPLAPSDWVIVIEAAQYPSGLDVLYCRGQLIEHGSTQAGTLTLVKCAQDPDGIFASGFES